MRQVANNASTPAGSQIGQSHKVALVESFADKIASGASVGWIAGPWLLMSIGFMSLIILRSRATEENVHGE
jgi:hypothetical protein